jgi:energy-converting hydrogenase Eha subunit F
MFSFLYTVLVILGSLYSHTKNKNQLHNHLTNSYQKSAWISLGFLLSS